MIPLPAFAVLLLLLSLAFAAYQAKALLDRWRDAATAARATHALRTCAALVLALACALHLAHPGGAEAWLLSLASVLLACIAAVLAPFSRRTAIPA